MAGSGSVRRYAVESLGAELASDGALSGGGSAILDAPKHALDGPSHTAKGDLHSAWTIVAGGVLAPTAGDPPTGEILPQVKTTTGAPTHTATEGQPCWVAPDDALYVSLGAGAWQVVGAGATALDDLTDVAITSPAASQRLRYDGAGWVNTDLIWRPVMVEDPVSGNWYVVVTGDGDAVMVEA